MDLDQLAEAVQSLQSQFGAQQEEKRFGQFMDQYGTKFGNDVNLGPMILAEMDRRLPPGKANFASQAANEALQAVLDELREESTYVLNALKDTFKESSQQISDLMDKTSVIEESMQAALGVQDSAASNPVADAAPPDGAMPDAGGAGVMDAGMPPDDMGGDPMAGGDMGGGDMGGGDMGGGDMGGGDMTPPDMGGGDMGGAPPMGDAGAAPPAPAPDAGGAPPMPPATAARGGFIPSDVRLKNLRAKFKAYNVQRKATGGYVKPASTSGWKPSKNLLSAIGAGE